MPSGTHEGTNVRSGLLSGTRRAPVPFIAAGSSAQCCFVFGDVDYGLQFGRRGVADAGP